MHDTDSPAALFEAYEQDFKTLLHGIKAKLEGGEGLNVTGSRRSAEEQKILLRKVEFELDEADDVLSQMQHTIQSIPKSLKQPYANRLKASKAELTKYKNKSRDLHAAASRSGLLGGNSWFGLGGDTSTSDNPYGESDERQRLLAGTEALTDGSRRLLDSQRIALETEEQGADILRSLRVQREQIDNARDTLRTADTSIDRASGTLKKMIRQMYRQRIILSLLTLVLLTVVVLILYFKLARR